MIQEVGLPHLFEGEAEFFEKVLQDGFRNYSEFGLGGSTLSAIRQKPENVVAIDSSIDWVRAVSSNSEVAMLIKQDRASIFYCDIGPVGDWGYPISKHRVENWPSYISLPWKDWERRGALPDLVYVDGRFRVACCASIALTFSRSKGQWPNVLMHDFVPARPSYTDILLLFDIVQQVNTLALLRLKPGFSAGVALNMLLARQFDAS